MQIFHSTNSLAIRIASTMEQASLQNKLSCQLFRNLPSRRSLISVDEISCLKKYLAALRKLPKLLEPTQY
jgi:hypothetical protein